MRFSLQFHILYNGGLTRELWLFSVWNVIVGLAGVMVGGEYI